MLLRSASTKLFKSPYLKLKNEFIMFDGFYKTTL